MATQEEEKLMPQQLKKNIKTLAEFDPESFVRREDLGTELCFEKGLEDFKKIINLYKELNECNIDPFPIPFFNTILNDSTEAIANFNKILNFSIGKTSKSPQPPAKQRDDLITNVRKNYDSSYNRISTQIAYLRSKKIDIGIIQKSVDKFIKENENKIAETLETIEKNKEKSEQILAEMRSAASELGVTQHSIHFRDEAKAHNTIAKYWLLATVVTIILAIAFSAGIISYYFTLEKILTTEKAISMGIGKLFLFSILYFAIVWTSRNYRAHRHNYIVNKHRQNALSTFKAFVDATEDKTIKNAVLLRSTETIFSPAVTGYTTTETEKAPSPQIIEIMRGFLEKPQS